MASISLIVAWTLLAAIASGTAPLAAQTADLDYLLGDRGVHFGESGWGKGRGYWTAVRIGEGTTILDEYCVVGDSGQTCPDRFSWRADRSADDGRTWQTDFLRIEARRIGPPCSMAAPTLVKVPSGGSHGP